MGIPLLPIREMQDPDCAPDLWWNTAKRHPREAMASPLYGLFLLEAPGLWSELQSEHQELWIKSYLNRPTVPPELRLAFATDCTERVLHLCHSQTYPIARKAIPLARAVVAEGPHANTVSFSEAEGALYDFKKKVDAIDRTVGISAYRANAGQEALSTVFYLCASPLGQEAWMSAQCAFNAVWRGNSQLSHWVTERRFQMEAEVKWQWNRLLSYLDAWPELLSLPDLSSIEDEHA